MSPLLAGALAGLQLLAGLLALAGRHTILRRIESLRALVELDPATGCLNRRGFARALDDAVTDASQAGSDIALLTMDLDHFKQVNDRFGHLAGDEVLVEVAQLMRDTIGSEGCIARLGGEEFAALLPRCDTESAGAMAEGMLQRLRVRQLHGIAAEVTMTMSVGIAVERASVPDVAAALRARSDEALYRAKRNGRNRVLLWAPGVRSLSTPAASATAIAQRRGWSSDILSA